MEDDDCVLECGVPNVLHVRDGLAWTGPEAGFPRLQSMREWRGAFTVVARAALSASERVAFGGERGEEEIRLDAELVDAGASTSSDVDGEREVRRRAPWLTPVAREGLRRVRHDDALRARGHRLVSAGFSRNAMLLSHAVTTRAGTQTRWVLQPQGGALGLPAGAFEACWIDRVLRALDPEGPGQLAFELAQWLDAPVPSVAVFRSHDEKERSREAALAMQRADVERVVLPSGRAARRVELPPYEERVYDTDPLVSGATSHTLTVPRRVAWSIA
jgi:hypothetical protein